MRVYSELVPVLGLQLPIAYQQKARVRTAEERRMDRQEVRPTGSDRAPSYNEMNADCCSAIRDLRLTSLLTPPSHAHVGFSARAFVFLR